MKVRDVKHNILSPVSLPPYAEQLKSALLFQKTNLYVSNARNDQGAAFPRQSLISPSPKVSAKTTNAHRPPTPQLSATFRGSRDSEILLGVCVYVSVTKDWRGRRLELNVASFMGFRRQEKPSISTLETFFF